MDKQTKPDISIPESFANNGTKTDFSETKIENGFERFTPEILAGDNLNKFIDDTYKGLNYSIKTSDAVNLINDEEILTVHDNFFRTLPLQNPLAYSTGKISEDKILFNEVKKRKRSTFDLSKFTVVGSPVIGADGGASGFSSNNYLTIQPIDISKPFKFSGTFTTGTDIYHSQAVFGGTMTSCPYFILGIHLDGYPIIYYPSTSTTIYWTKLSKIVSPNTTYGYELTFDGTNLTFNLTDGASYNLTMTPTNFDASKLGVLSSLYIGRNATGTYVMQPDATIDLSQFSITVDGKEVFSGNKTGSDVIKPDNYTVVGSPVISDDGVASGFSSSAYLTLPIIFQPSNKKWEIDFKITPNSINTHNDFFGSSSGTDYKHIGLGVASNGKLALFLSSNGTSWDVASDKKGTTSIKTGTLYYLKLIYNGTSYKLYSSTNNIDWITEISIDNSNAIYQNTAVQSLGVNKVSSSNYYPFTGSIDLNAFKIYVDGNLVYQPCLKIPYTESKTGSKIVDEVYRDRVIDLYEQEGQAGYYTIDEENQNFTLPMGEIYGMIEDKATKNYIEVVKNNIESELSKKADVSTPSIQSPYLKTTYLNGASGYNIWSNGYCEQWGYLSCSSHTNNTITLTKTYVDINYNIMAANYGNGSTGTNTASSIVVKATAVNRFQCTLTEYSSSNVSGFYWETKGYLAEGEY